MLLEVLEASRCFHQSGFKPAAFTDFATGAQIKWGGEDSNLRSLSATGLQPVPVDHLGNLPKRDTFFSSIVKECLFRDERYIDIYTNQEVCLTTASTICTHFDCLLLSLSGSISVQFMFYLYTILRFLSTSFFRFLNFSLSALNGFVFHSLCEHCIISAR